MSNLEFDDSGTQRVERIYMGPDIVAQREDTLRRLALAPGEAVLDIGSGPGYLCESMAQQVGPAGRVRGIDISPQMIARSAARSTHDNVSYVVADAIDLPADDGSFDVVVSTQVAEYVEDVDAFCVEAFRALRPGGRLLVIATDWDAIAWHTGDRDRMAKVMEAFEAHCADPRLPRTLLPRLKAAGFVDTSIDTFPLISTEFVPGTYAYGIAALIREYTVGRNGVTRDEADAWYAELEQLSASGDYYFASGRVIFESKKPA